MKDAKQERTYEDWLKSLPTEELADVLNKIAYCEGQIICDDELCEQCNLYTYCHTDWESPSYKWWLRAIKKD